MIAVPIILDGLQWVTESAKSGKLLPGFVGKITKETADEINLLGFSIDPSSVLLTKNKAAHIGESHGQQLSEDDLLFLRETIESPTEILPNVAISGKTSRSDSVLLIKELTSKSYIAIAEISAGSGNNYLKNYWRMSPSNADRYLKKFRQEKARIIHPGGRPTNPHIPVLPGGKGGKPEGLSGSQDANASPSTITPDANNVKKITESATRPAASKGGNIMGETIKCRFNLFNEGRKYTGHHRNYILESAVKVCYAPETREGIRLREKLGYLGHGRREIARKLQLAEVEPVRLPDGSTIIVENVPSNITTFFEVNKDGLVEHHQELLDTAPGKVVAGLNASRVGGFSWACGGVDGGTVGATKLTDFHGFDYVMNPGFADNRGYILESADGKARDMIIESICKAGVQDSDAERYLQSWVASAQLRAMELEERLEQAAIFEDAVREDLEGKVAELAALRKAIEDDAASRETRKKLIMECAQKSVIVVPDRVVNAMLSMAGEADFNEILGFFESAGRVDLGILPLPGQQQGKERPKLAPQYLPSDIEYGSAAAGYDFSEKLTFGR